MPMAQGESRLPGEAALRVLAGTRVILMEFIFYVDSELTWPVLVAHQMSASSVFVLLWDCGQGACLVHILSGRPPSGFKRLFFLP